MIRLRTNLDQVSTLAIRRDHQSGEQLGELNAQLTQSFKRCRALLTACREKLTPASKEREPRPDHGGTRT